MGEPTFRELIVRVDERQQATLDKIEKIEGHMATQNARQEKTEQRMDDVESWQDKVKGGAKTVAWIVGALSSAGIIGLLIKAWG